MNENINVNEILPREQYTFKYEENEIKEIHKKQLRPRIISLIVSAIWVIILIGSKVIFDISNITFGLVLGVFLILTVIHLCGIIAFRKGAKPAVAAMSKREYIYSFFDETLKIEVIDQGNKVSEEHRKYTDIQAINDIGAYILLTISGRIFVIRKADFSANSLLLTVFDEPIKKAKVAKKRRNIALVLAFICFAGNIALGTLGELSEKSTKDQAMENMKAAIEKTYDEYELLTRFNVKKDGKFVDSLVLVESGGKVDVLRYASKDGEALTVDIYIGLSPDDGDVMSYLYGNVGVVMRIYSNDTDIPEKVDIKEQIQYNGQIMYFCITFIDE